MNGLLIGSDICPPDISLYMTPIGYELNLILFLTSAGLGKYPWTWNEQSVNSLQTHL